MRTIPLIAKGYARLVEFKAAYWPYIALVSACSVCQKGRPPAHDRQPTRKRPVRTKHSQSTAGEPPTCCHEQQATRQCRAPLLHPTAARSNAANAVHTGVQHVLHPARQCQRGNSHSSTNNTTKHAHTPKHTATLHSTSSPRRLRQCAARIRAPGCCAALPTLTRGSRRCMHRHPFGNPPSFLHGAACQNCLAQLTLSLQRRPGHLQ